MNSLYHVSEKCQKKNKLIKFNKCEETRAMLILKFQCLSVATQKKSRMPIIKTSVLAFI
jgi:hypothetical protein